MTEAGTAAGRLRGRAKVMIKDKTSRDKQRWSVVFIGENG
jgi:hypothetical protein